MKFLFPILSGKIFLMSIWFFPLIYSISICLVLVDRTIVLAQGNEKNAVYANSGNDSTIERSPVDTSNANSAEQNFLNTLKLNPKDLVALNNIGMFYLQLGKFEKAREYLLKAAELYSDDYLTHYNLGTFYGYVNDIQNAISHLNMAVELNTQSDKIFSALGSFYLRENKLAEAEESFLATLNINAENTNALFGLMSVYQNENRIEEALETGKKLLAVDNKYQQLHFVLSGLYFLKNDLTNALVNAKEERSLYPDEPESYYMFVLIYNKTGNKNKYMEMVNKLNEVIKKHNSGQLLLNNSKNSFKRGNK